MTLVEVLIAASAGLIVAGAATWFTLECTRISYTAMSQVENGVQQWSMATKLQIDGGVANGATIVIDAIPSSPNYLSVVPVDDGNKDNGLERGSVLILSKSQLNQGVDTKIITDLIIYVYTPGAGSTGTLKRFPGSAPTTFPVTDPLDAKGLPKTVVALVDENITNITANLKLVIDKVTTVAGADKGPFACIGNSQHVTTALVRNETVGSKSTSTLTEVSFNLR